MGLRAWDCQRLQLSISELSVVRGWTTGQTHFMVGPGRGSTKKHSCGEYVVLKSSVKSDSLAEYCWRLRCLKFCLQSAVNSNIAKGTMDPRGKYFKKITFLKPYHMLVKIQVQNLNQTSASKSHLNFNFKLLTKPYAESLNSFMFSFMTKPQLLNLQQTVVNTILIINISNSNNFNKFWEGIFTRQGHINQVY